MKDPVKIRAEKSNINEEIAKECAEWLGGAEMTEKMKKCPFCGGEPQMLKGFIKGITMIVCSECKATVSFGGQESCEASLKAWNRRTK